MMVNLSDLVQRLILALEIFNVWGVFQCVFSQRQRERERERERGERERREREMEIQ